MKYPNTLAQRAGAMEEKRRISLGDLTWVRPKRLTQEYTLLRDRTTLATLRFGKRMGSLASAEWGNSRWTFKRVGLFRPRVTVRVQGSEKDIAVFELGWSWTGTLRFSPGPSYRWTSVSFWSQEWAFLREDGSAAVRFWQRALGRKGRVKIESDSERLADLPVLVLLGWYLLVLIAREEDASAAATVSAVASAGS